MRVPAASTIAPARMSFPRGRTNVPGASGPGTTTDGPSRRQSSWMAMASAPSGIGAPVKIRAASPAARAEPTSPAAIRWVIRSDTSPARGMSAARTA